MGMEELEMAKDNIQIRCTNRSCYFHSQYIPWPVNTPLMPCQLCGSDMEQLKDSENELGWLLKIADDEDKWASDVENTFPAVLAYEYKCLKEYCKKDEPFAVLLSIKDNFEALLKFEVLLAYAWAAKNTNDAFKANTLSLIVTPNLTLGSWIELASIIVRDLKKENLQLPDIIPLDSLRKIYIEEEIVNWRNTNIGHGAMALETDDEFRKDIQDKILLLKEIYYNYGLEFGAQKIYLKDDINEELDFTLMGADRARGLEHTGKVYFRGEDTGLDLSVDPFLVIRKHPANGYGIYFFDNQRTKSLTHFLAYADGRRAIENVAYFESLRRQLDTGKIKLEAKSDERDLTPEEIHELDMLQMSHEFVKPKHLVKWLEGCLDKYDRGVFLLQMNRGMGKSIFTERLSGLAEKPVQIVEDIDVRTYHMGTTQAAGIGYFRDEIEELWRKDYDGKPITRMVRISELEKEGKTPAEALCGCLEQILKYTKRNRGKSRLLMVLDGLDEIPGEELWNFIPKADMMGKGIYFLLTSRDPATEELPEETVSKLDGLSVTERFCPERHGKENAEFLSEYIDNTGLREKTGLLDKQKLLSLSDYRVLELGMLCRLAENGMEIKDLPDSSKVVSVYLKMLEKRYGEKESIQFREILAILCTLGSYEGLTLKTIGYLIGETGITLRLIGMIRDLVPMLRTERGDKFNRYMITNPGLAGELKTQIPEMEDLVRKIIDLTVSVLDDGSYMNGEIDEIVVHIAELSRDFLPEGMKALKDDISDQLTNYYNNYLSELLSGRSFDMELKIWNQTLLFDKERFGPNDEKTIWSEVYLAEVLCETYQLNDGIRMMQRAYDKAKGIFGEDNSDILKVCYKYGTILNRSGNYKKALSILKKAYEKSNEIQGADSYETLSIGDELYDALYSLGYYEEAGRLASVLCKKVEENNYNDDDFMVTYKGIDIHGSQNAKECEEQLRLERDKYDNLLKSLGPDEYETYQCLEKLQLLNYKLGNYEEALLESKKTYRLCKKFYGANNPYTVSSLEAMADILVCLKRFEEAFTLQKEVCILKEKGLGKEHVFVFNSKIKLAKILIELDSCEEAINLLIEVFEDQERKLGENHPDLIKTIKWTNRALTKKGETIDALDLFIKVTEKIESILGEYHPVSLAVNYDLANFLEKIERYEDAVVIYQVVYEIRRRILGMNNPDTLMAGYKTASTLCDIGKYDEALQMGKKVYKKRREIFGEENIDTVDADSLLSRILKCLGRYEEALRIQKDVYELKKHILGEDNGSTIVSEYMLAFLLFKLERYEDALPFSKEAYEKMSKRYGETDEKAKEIKGLYDRLISLEK